MLDFAEKYERTLIEKFREIKFDDFFKFYTGCSYYNEYSSEKSTWSMHEFVSLNLKGEVIGYIKYEIKRDSLNCSNLTIINFTNTHKIIFGHDVAMCIDDIFRKFNFRKLSYTVLIGNKIEKTYDRLTSKYGGKIVGTSEKHTKLMDGQYYDMKHYEILRENYVEQYKKFNSKRLEKKELEKKELENKERGILNHG